MKIVIAPYSAQLVSRLNAKNYPWWERLVELLNREGYEVVQIGVSGEDRIEGVGLFVTNWPFAKIKDLINQSATWISVDSWLPHFCHCERLKAGIVLWGPSDPRIFGYRENVNLLRDRSYLRHFQYAPWDEVEFNANAFVYAENVLPHVLKLAPLPPKAMVLTANAAITTA